MKPADLYGMTLTTTSDAAEAYNEGVRALLRVQEGSLDRFGEAIARDPAFALAHAAVALLGHELGRPVDTQAALTAARRHARRATPRERSHVRAVIAHVSGDHRPLISHLSDWPRDALLLSVAVPTIAFSGVTTVPEHSWQIVERCRPAYGEDWWFCGLLAFVRQEQGRFDDAMALACRALDEDAAAGQAVHARAHAHYETGEHVAGLRWLDGWIAGPGRTADSLAHFSWHAALHELSLGDLSAVRARYTTQLAPPTVVGCRALVDSCSLLWRWALTPQAEGVPGVDAALALVEAELIDTPPTPFVALHAAVALCAQGNRQRLHDLKQWSLGHAEPTFREVVAPLCTALEDLAAGQPSLASDRLVALRGAIPRLGGSDAQREVVDDTLIATLLASGRVTEALPLLDERLDRRPSPRDETWRALAPVASE